MDSLRKEINNRFIKAYNELKRLDKIMLEKKDKRSLNKFCLAVFGNTNRIGLLNTYLKKERHFPVNRIKNLSKHYGVSEIWMLTGKGEMFKDYTFFENGIKERQSEFTIKINRAIREAEIHLKQLQAIKQNIIL